MNKQQIFFISIGFILLALMATNPSIEDHREGVKEMYKKKLGEMNKDKTDDLATQIGTGIGMMIGDGFIDKIVSRDNYLLFSLTKATVGNKTQNIGFGILGKVFIKELNNIDKSLVNNTETEPRTTQLKQSDAIQKGPEEIITDGTIYPIAISWKEIVLQNGIVLYYNYEQGSEDDGSLSLTVNLKEYTKIPVVNFDENLFVKTGKVRQVEWKYDENGNCKAYWYDLKLLSFKNEPNFEKVITNVNECAG